MPFEPKLPAPWNALIFDGDMQTQVTDPHGLPVATIIRLNVDWHLQVNWQVTGGIVPMLSGDWHIRAYLESMGPGNDLIVVDQTVPITGANNYSQLFFVGPGQPAQAGAYKLVTVLTSSGFGNAPGIVAGYDEGPILQFH